MTDEPKTLREQAEDIVGECFAIPDCKPCGLCIADRDRILGLARQALEAARGKARWYGDAGTHVLTEEDIVALFEEVGDAVD